MSDNHLGGQHVDVHAAGKQVMKQEHNGPGYRNERQLSSFSVVEMARTLPSHTRTGAAEASEKETEKESGNLAAFQWASVYRSLRPFLRPFGDSGEGRLDFYHRSLSKAVRKK